MTLDKRRIPLDLKKKVDPQSSTTPNGSFNRYIGAAKESSRIDGLNKHQTFEEIMQGLDARKVAQLQGPRSSGESARTEFNEQVKHLNPRQKADLEKDYLSKIKLIGGGDKLQKQIKQDLAEAKKQEIQFLRERYLEALLHGGPDLERCKQQQQQRIQQQQQQRIQERDRQKQERELAQDQEQER